jgi:hypothetical protein
VGDIVGAYKSLVANAWLKIYKSNHQTTGKLWQRNFGKIGKPYRENFHFAWAKVPFTIPVEWRAPLHRPATLPLSVRQTDR